MNIDELQKKDSQYLLGNYSRVWVDFERGSNARLWTREGREFIDFGSGIGVCSVGHANPRLNAALNEQLSKLTHISNLYGNALQARLAERIVGLSGMDMRVFFSNSGAEANECAIKIARKFGESSGGRYKIITLESSFHGRTIATLKATGQVKMHQFFGPFPDGFVIAKDIAEIYELLDEKTCGVMLELVQGEGGVCALPQDEVRALEKHLKERNVLLMVDEVQSGVYRSGRFLASQVYGVCPDVISLAKGLGGGIPIGATLTNLKDIFGYGDHGSTFGGNFLSMRSGLEVLEILEGQGREIARKIEAFGLELEGVLQKYPDLFIEVVGLGLMRGLRAQSQGIWEAVLKSAFDEGVLVLKSGQSVVRFLPALTISDEEIAEGFVRFHRACEKLARG